jgi:hypothetical protein
MRSLLLPHNLELQLIRQANGSGIRRLPRIHIARTAALSHESHVSCHVRVEYHEAQRLVGWAFQQGIEWTAHVRQHDGVARRSA